MITSIFHKHLDLLGLNIQRNTDNSFVVSVAYRTGNNWKAKTLSGISGDFDNETLVEQAMKNGNSLDKQTAIKIFSNILDYDTNGG